MGNTDSMPIVSQTKSLVQVMTGDAEGARRTQENFSRQCVGISQARSLVESTYDREAALETQEQFLEGVASDVVGKKYAEAIKDTITTELDSGRK